MVIVQCHNTQITKIGMRVKVQSYGEPKETGGHGLEYTASVNVLWYKRHSEDAITTLETHTVGT
ncbi:hypothetical protein CEK25_008749 [Fusarium fujikuroi]|nr:hypothetical protein CEK25_008749 [Fusarium fujikuroi]